MTDQTRSKQPTHSLFQITYRFTAKQTPAPAFRTTHPISSRDFLLRHQSTNTTESELGPPTYLTRRTDVSPLKLSIRPPKRAAFVRERTVRLITTFTQPHTSVVASLDNPVHQTNTSFKMQFTRALRQAAHAAQRTPLIRFVGRHEIPGKPLAAPNLSHSTCLTRSRHVLFNPSYSHELPWDSKADLFSSQD